MSRSYRIPIKEEPVSRAYRVAVNESVSKTVRVEDGISASVEMLPILARERMGEILADELGRRGFTRDGGTTTRRDPDGIEVSVDLAAGAVTVRAAEERAITKSATRESRGDEDFVRPDVAEARLRDRVRGELEAAVEDDRKAMSSEITKRLERRIGEVSREIDGAVNAVTAAALKERAAQIGTIEEMTEEEGGGLTIKVRV